MMCVNVKKRKRTPCVPKEGPDVVCLQLSVEFGQLAVGANHSHQRVVPLILQRQPFEDACLLYTSDAADD